MFFIQYISSEDKSKRVEELQNLINELKIDGKEIETKTIKTAAKLVLPYVAIAVGPPAAIVGFSIFKYGWNGSAPNAFALLATGYTFGVGAGLLGSGYIKRTADTLHNDIEGSLKNLSNIKKKIKEYRNEISTLNK